MAGGRKRILLNAPRALPGALPGVTVVRMTVITTLLAAVALCAGAPWLMPAAAAAEAPDGWLDSKPIDPIEVPRRAVKLDNIETQDFELGVYAGVLSVEDFGVDSVKGVTGAYHVTEDLFLEGVYFRSTLGRTSFERLSGSVDLLTQKQRALSHYGINLGFDILPGESYIGPWAAVNSAIYLVGGVGATDFGGDNRFTVTLGVGYRMLATNWFSLQLDVRDHIFQSDLLGAQNSTNNLEIRSGFTIYF